MSLRSHALSRSRSRGRDTTASITSAQEPWLASGACHREGILRSGATEPSRGQLGSTNYMPPSCAGTDAIRKSHAEMGASPSTAAQHVQDAGKSAVMLINDLAKSSNWPFGPPSALDLSVQRLLAARANLHLLDEDGHTALMIAAAQRGGARSVRILLDAGADIHDCDGRGATALLWSAGYGGDVEVARLLLEARADLETRDQDGVTPLMAACNTGNGELVNLLLGARADIESMGELGSSVGSAVTVAEAAGHPAIVRTLLEAATGIQT